MAYHLAAEYYDIIYREKDYAGEAQVLHRIITEAGTPPGAALLDVACGTGSHLVHLTEHYTCAGVDLSPGLLAVAGQKLPGVPLHQGDMRTFDLGRTFHVVTCLFSAIGHMLTEDDLRAAIANMGRHVAPRGLLIIEGWLRREDLHLGRVSATFIDEPDLKIMRMNTLNLEGHITWFDFHYLVGTPAGVEHFVERLEAAMYPDETYFAAFEAAGVPARVERPGLNGRGLFIGRKAGP